MTSIFLPIMVAVAQTQGSPSNPLVQVWPSAPPDGWTRAEQESWSKNEKENFMVVSAVSHPTLELFLVAKARPHVPTVIVCPGGGHNIEAIEHEGWEIAKRLNMAGINAAVLKYRLPNRETDQPLYKAPLQDAQRSIRLLRSLAGKYRIDPDRVGIMGFSAGGHLAAVTSTAASDSYAHVDSRDELSPKPNFTVLIYPAYLENDGKLVLNPEVQVSKESPPAFIAQTLDDPIQVENALAYAEGCRMAGVEAELHVWAKGGHGYGLRTKQPGLSTWPDLLIDWLKRTMPF
jgi:acetyl esterase/lipase